MQTYQRLLVRIDLEKLSDARHTFLGTFGAKPKVSTGYRNQGHIAIPLKFLLRDGFSFLYDDDSWYEKGSVLINNEPCYYFSNNEVDILTGD
ncbi:hypothetical protein pVco7_gp065 [Vibrio phage pVco-7]|uniref:Uncharacterized protein n=1 Tax=Vibrio phage pVco-5 TaxID=1965485 RepID=A0A1W6JUV3_9CAUD|nr:hypothetical protein KNT61_gp066 [Vibrio phage pVco-5]ARM71054.1 hypothetical protein pVco5_066 [Vibrio phage pVco-5]